jgi:hypothetical protein
MKKYMILSVVSGMIFASCGGQNISSNKVPSVVRNTLSTSYPQVQQVDWDREGKFYEAEWNLNDSLERSVLIDDSGKIVMQKEDIPNTGLASAILSAVQTLHPGYAVDDVEKIDRDGKTYFQVELKKTGSKELHLVFTPDGKEEKSFTSWD